MDPRTADGLVWVSAQPPHFKDWRGKLAYKALYAGTRRQGQAGSPSRAPRLAPAPQRSPARRTAGWVVRGGTSVFGRSC